MDDQVYHPVILEIFSGLETFRQFLANGIFNHPLAGKNLILDLELVELAG